MVQEEIDIIWNLQQIKEDVIFLHYLLMVYKYYQRKKESLKLLKLFLCVKIKYIILQ